MNFFNNFVVESVDHRGRTSMRQIVTQERQGRPSIIQNQLSGTTSELRPSHGQHLKFIRKSELSQDLFSNKSIIRTSIIKPGNPDARPIT